MASGATVSFLLCPDVVLCVGLAGDSSSASKWWWHVHLGSDNQRTQGHHVGRYYSSMVQKLAALQWIFTACIFFMSNTFERCNIFFFNWNDFVFLPFLGGVFKLYMQFSEAFDTLPPKVCFHTIPFHPNGKFWSHTWYTKSSGLEKMKIPALGEVFFWNSTSSLYPWKFKLPGTLCKPQGYHPESYSLAEN